MNINGRPTNPGELRTRISLETSIIGQDAGGAQSAVWTQLAEVYAKWENVHGQEVWASQAVQAQMPATVLIRYRADVTQQTSIVKAGERYQIYSMDDIQNRHEYLELKVLLVKGSI